METMSALQRKLTILSTSIIIQVVHNYKSGNTIPENVSLSVPTTVSFFCVFICYVMCHQRVSTIYHKT